MFADSVTRLFLTLSSLSLGMDRAPNLWSDIPLARTADVFLGLKPDTDLH